MLVEWRGQENITPVVWIGDNAVNIKFFPQPRYCGTRTREISDPSAVATLLYGNYKPYVGPILEAIPEFDKPGQDVDWFGGLRKLKESVPPLIWKSFIAQQAEIPIAVGESEEDEELGPDAIEVPPVVEQSKDEEPVVEPANPPRLVSKRKPGRPKTRV